MPELPKPSGIVSGVANWGVPLVGGAIGFFAVGDIGGGAQSIISEWVDTSGLPLSDKLDYTALLATIPYGIVLFVSHAIGSKIGDFPYKPALFRTVNWFLVGIILRLVVHALLPSRVPASGAITVPAVTR